MVVRGAFKHVWLVVSRDAREDDGDDEGEQQHDKGEQNHVQDRIRMSPSLFETDIWTVGGWRTLQAFGTNVFRFTPVHGIKGFYD